MFESESTVALSFAIAITIFWAVAVVLPTIFEYRGRWHKAFLWGALIIGTPIGLALVLVLAVMSPEGFGDERVGYAYFGGIPILATTFGLGCLFLHFLGFKFRRAQKLLDGNPY